MKNAMAQPDSMIPPSLLRLGGDHLMLFLFIAGLSSPTRNLCAADPPTAPPRFVVIVNDYEKPEFARALLASTYEDFGTVVAIGTGERQSERVYKQKVKQVIPIPDLKIDLLDPSQFLEVGRSLADLTSAVEIYPQLRAHLLPLGSEMKTIVDSGAAGLVRRAGAWAKLKMPESEAPATLVLRELSGREYRNAEITGKEPDGLMVKHEGGVSKVLFANLPKEIRDKYEFDPIEAEKYRQSREMAVTGSVDTPEMGPKGGTPDPNEGSADTSDRPTGAHWVPASVADAVDCSLFVDVKKGITGEGLEGSWSGSAFLCNVDGVSYIYSNAHNFDGAKEFRIFDKQDREYANFLSVEIAADGQAFWREKGWGGDVVRFRLPEFQEKALTLNPIPANDSIIGRKILITGNTKGRGEITELEGLVTEIKPDRIIFHNAETQAGNSGSPIIDLESFTVIGILTWGMYDDENPMSALWSKQPPEERVGINKGAGLAGLRFVPVTLETLYRQRVVMNELKRNTRLLGLLDTLVPTKGGLFVDRTKIVMGGYSVDDLLSESSDHVVVKELTALDEFLSTKAESNIGISNHEVLKRYRETYSRAVAAVSDHRQAIENSNSVTFFMKCSLERSKVLKISTVYEAVLMNSEAWYARQLGTSGDAIPLGDRIRLPRMESGLEGLGIQKE